VKLLLDTHLLLWSAGKPERLSTEARALIEALDNELFFSSASLWEVVIKRGLGRDDFKVDARLLRRGLLDNGYSELPIGSEHVVPSKICPPFTRIPSIEFWLAQAQVEGITLLTADPTLAKYPGPIRLV